MNGVFVFQVSAVLPSYAILMDGGFVREKIKHRTKAFPTIADIEAEIARIRGDARLAALTLLRIYYYDAPPASGVVVNPIDNSQTDLGSHPTAAANLSLQQKIELLPDVAVRYGELQAQGWQLGSAAMRSLQKNGARAIAAGDLVPNIKQKGVDLRIGLDIARLSLRDRVSAIVVVTGDSDMIPAFKFARREGVRIYLDHMGHGVKRDLKVHSDIIL